MDTPFSLADFIDPLPREEMMRRLQALTTGETISLEGVWLDESGLVLIECTRHGVVEAERWESHDETTGVVTAGLSCPLCSAASVG